MKHRTAWLAMLAFALLFLGGCDSSGDVVSDTGSPGGSEAPLSPASSDRPTFGIIYPMSHPFYEMITQYA
ncbi:MAG: hypothetical protein J7559_21500, partial [Cohnella sp.]|nr:hypothetical protein [Cohnella sp.]